MHRHLTDSLSPELLPEEPLFIASSACAVLERPLPGSGLPSTGILCRDEDEDEDFEIDDDDDDFGDEEEFGDDELDEDDEEEEDEEDEDED